MRTVVPYRAIFSLLAALYRVIAPCVLVYQKIYAQTIARAEIRSEIHR